GGVLRFKCALVRNYLPRSGYERQYSISRGQRCHYETPLASLLRICRDAVEAVPDRIAAAGEAVALRLSRAAHRHPPDAHGRSGGESGQTERRIPLAIHCRPRVAKAGWA